MLRDIKSSYEMASAIPPQTITVGDENGVSVDHSKANSCAFFIDVGAVTGTVDAKVQHSPDNIVWTDDDGASNNDVTITQLTAPGQAQLNVVNPQERYSRVVVTIGGTSAVLSMVSVLGPLRTIAPTDL